MVFVIRNHGFRHFVFVSTIECNPGKLRTLMSEPGAKMFTQLPMLENPERVSSVSEEATVYDFDADPGDLVHASLPPSLLFEHDPNPMHNM